MSASVILIHDPQHQPRADELVARLRVVGFVLALSFPADRVIVLADFNTWNNPIFRERATDSCGGTRVFVWLDRDYPAPDGETVWLQGWHGGALQESSLHDLETALGPPDCKPARRSGASVPEWNPTDSAVASPASASEVAATAFCPSDLRKGSRFVIQLWLHRADQRNRVATLAADYFESGGATADRAGFTDGMDIPPGTLVHFALVPQVLHTESSILRRRKTIVRSLKWNGRPANVEFSVCCPASCRDDVVHETIEIAVEGISIASCTVSLDFESGAGKSGFSRIRTAFASYSTEDQELVLGRVLTLKAIGVDTFIDVDSIRIGDKWEERIYEQVTKKDRFFLFWSPAARASTWVDREWRMALRERGIDYILPVPVSPAPPPNDLKLHSRQFNDRLLILADYERLKRERIKV